MNEEIIFKWDREWDKEYVGNSKFHSIIAK